MNKNRLPITKTIRPQSRSLKLRPVILLAAALLLAGCVPRLQEASHDGNVSKVQDLLAKGENANAPGLFGITALQEAAAANKIDVARILIAHGADVNQADNTGATPLESAAWTGNTDMVRLLLEHGADPNITDDNGNTALFYAVKYHHPDIIALLNAQPSASRAGAIAAPNASAPGSIRETTYAGKRFAIRVLADCPRDPDPTGLANDDLYSKCEQSELDKIKRWIGAALINKYGIAAITDENPDYFLTVTITQDMADEGGAAAGIAEWVLPITVHQDTVKFSATYRLTDSKGKTAENGKVHLEGGGMGNALKIEQEFSEKIAAAVIGDRHARRAVRRPRASK